MATKEYPSAPVVAVGAVVIRDGKVLLVRRRNPPGEGQWAIPGGSVHLAESLQEAAEREIREETGIGIRAGESIYVCDKIGKDEKSRIRYHYVIIDLEAEYLWGEPEPGDDALEACWLSPGELDRLRVGATTLDLPRKIKWLN